MLQSSRFQELIDQLLQSIDIVQHRSIKGHPLRRINGASIKRLEIEFQRRDRALQLVGDAVDEIALTPIQVDLLNAPNQIEHHTCYDADEHGGTRAQQHPVKPW
jgi:hypothetical protein